MADLAIGSLVQRSSGGPIGTIVHLWTAPVHYDYKSGARIPERRMARVRWNISQSGGVRLGSGSGGQSRLQLDSLRAVPLCPECGSQMRLHGRGATAKRRSIYWTCPVADGEVYNDAEGRLRRIINARHTATRSWTEAELTAPIE